jgi:hypothetical protein
MRTIVLQTVLTVNSAKWQKMVLAPPSARRRPYHSNISFRPGRSAKQASISDMLSDVFGSTPTLPTVTQLASFILNE